jgi:O-antigen/teichoic acid export membrane protein
VSYAIDHLIIALILLFYYRKLGGQGLSVSGSRFRKMLSTSKHFILSSMMVTIFAQTDKIMLKFMVSDEAVGIYSVAVSCAGMTSFVFAAIIDSVRPSAFEYKKCNQARYEKCLVMCYSVIIGLSLVQSAFMSMFSKLIIQIMYGVDYMESANVLCLVVWYTTFSYIGPVRNIWLMAEEKQKYLWMINMMGALTNVLLNAIMIPVIGVMGAALASLITQIFTNVIVGYILKPIRYNNALMIKALNPQMLMDGIRSLRR